MSVYLNRWLRVSKRTKESRVQSSKLIVLKAWRLALQEKILGEATNAFKKRQRITLIRHWRRQLSLLNWTIHTAIEAAQIGLKRMFIRKWRRINSNPRRDHNHVTFVTEPLVRIYNPPYTEDVTERTDAQRWINETPKTLKTAPFVPPHAPFQSVHYQPRIPSKLTSNTISVPGSIFTTGLPVQSIDSVSTPKSKSGPQTLDSPIQHWFGRDSSDHADDSIYF